MDYSLNKVVLYFTEDNQVAMSTSYDDPETRGPTYAVTSRSTLWD